MGELGACGDSDFDDGMPTMGGTVSEDEGASERGDTIHSASSLLLSMSIGGGDCFAFLFFFCRTSFYIRIYKTPAVPIQAGLLPGLQKKYMRTGVQTTRSLLAFFSITNLFFHIRAPPCVHACVNGTAEKTAEAALLPPL